jgi:opacity protein-like surface antigen
VYNYKISAQYLYGLVSYKSFTLIFRGGPFIGFSKRDHHDEYISPSYSNKYIVNDKTFSFGLDIILGVEYKLIENIIFSGEYGLTIAKNNTDIDETSNYSYYNGSPAETYSQKGKSHTFTAGGMGVSLGVAVFF